MDHINKIFVAAKGRFPVVCAAEGLTKNMAHLLLSEKSLKDRRSRVRGIGSLQQLAGLHAYYSQETLIPEKPRAAWEGTNSGNVIGPIDFESWESSWKMQKDHACIHV